MVDFVRKLFRSKRERLINSPYATLVESLRDHTSEWRLEKSRIIVHTSGVGLYHFDGTILLTEDYNVGVTKWVAVSEPWVRRIIIQEVKIRQIRLTKELNQRVAEKLSSVS